MNVGELLRERDRLLSVLEEAKSAKARLKQLNVLIAMYGDDEKVSLNGSSTKLCVVGDCDNPIKTRGLCNGHYQKWNKQLEGWEDLDKIILPSKTTGKVSERKF